MGRETEGVYAAYNNYNRSCGEMLVGEGLVDRDLGNKEYDNIMIDFIHSHLANFQCEDEACSNSNLEEDVDVDQWLKNIAVYSVTMGQDSLLGNGNNYYLADTGDGNGWKIVSSHFAGD